MKHKYIWSQLNPFYMVTQEFFSLRRHLPISCYTTGILEPP